MSIRAKKFAEVLLTLLKENSNEKNQIAEKQISTKIKNRLKLKYKKGETSYSKLSEIRSISVGLASSQTIRRWAQKSLPNGKILGLVTSADTLHYKTFKPLKGGLFCERIFGPLRDFECACGIQKRPSLEDYQKIVQHQPVERRFCPTCDVEYTWSIMRRYQLGYIELVTPVGHIWYSKGQPNYLSILLEWKKKDLESFFYCTTSSALEESLQIFNNPFLVDPGFTNPLFDVDWADFTQPSSYNSLQQVNNNKYKKFQKEQTLKRSVLMPKKFQKLNSDFLQSKFTKSFHFNGVKDTALFSYTKKEQTVLGQAFEVAFKSTCPNIDSLNLYNALAKKAIKIVYKNAYLLAHQKVTNKLSMFSFSTMRTALQKQAEAKAQQESFLYRFQKLLLTYQTMKVERFPYKKFIQVLHKLNMVNKNALFSFFLKNNILFSKQKPFFEDLKFNKKRFKKKFSANKQNPSIKSLIQNFLKKLIFVQLKNSKISQLLKNSSRKNLKTTVFRLVFNQNFLNQLNLLAQLLSKTIIRNIFSTSLEQKSKMFLHFKSLDQFEMLNLISKISENKQTKHLNQTTNLLISEKEMDVLDLFLIRQKYRVKKWFFLTQNFPFYKSNNITKMEPLLTHLGLVLKKSNFKLNLTKKNLDQLVVKEKEEQIFSFKNPLNILWLKKEGVFFQKNVNFKNAKKLKLAETILKNRFYWKSGSFLSTKKFKSHNLAKNNGLGNLHFLSGKLVQSILSANKVKTFSKSEHHNLPNIVNTKNVFSFNLKKQSPFVKPKELVSSETEFEQSASNTKKNTFHNNNCSYNYLILSKIFHPTKYNNQKFTKQIRITGQNQKLALFHILDFNNMENVQCLLVNKINYNENTDNSCFFAMPFAVQEKNYKAKKTNKEIFSSPSQIYENLNQWLSDKLAQYSVNKRILRSHYGVSYLTGQKPVLRNYIYLLSSREKKIFEEEKRPVYFLNYCRGYASFDDIWLPLYKFKGLDNPLITLTGTGILQRFLVEFDNFKELSKMEKQYRVDLMAIEQKIRELKILSSIFMSVEELRKLEKLIKKQVSLLRKTKLIRKLFVKKSKLSSTLITTLPVLPPDLRPILKMQGQVAASDLNRLYQRVIYRNNRLKKLRKTSGCLPTDLKYAQRLLQEAVDNLIQNGKSGGSPEVDSRGRPLKSLSELLKGKQGRFRQNLLGKRVDYSGRSVIVVGPTLKIHECGLPKEIAVELFLPFLIQKILHFNMAKTVMGAKSLIKANSSLCSSLLVDLMQSHPILLNRAPTLHRLGFQAFQPKLIEGRAILLHPLVCPAFNADFDGDQMAVHLPLTVEARAEAWKLMLSRNHLISAATGSPVMLPSQDMVLGCYYLTIDVLKVKQPTTSLIQIKDFETVASCKEKMTTYQNNNQIFINQKIFDQLALMLKNASNVKPVHNQKMIFHKYFNNFEQVIKAYQQQKLKTHSDIWVKWNNPVETLSPKSRSGRASPMEIQVNVDGSWNEVRFKYVRRFTKNNIQIHQYIRTTPGRVLFYDLIQNCIK